MSVTVPLQQMNRGSSFRACSLRSDSVIDPFLGVDLLWTGTGMHPSNKKAATRDDLNHLGGYLGLLVTSPSDASVDEMIAGDLRTAEAFGANVAGVVQDVRR